jgi:hypothetical protein
MYPRTREDPGGLARGTLQSFMASMLSARADW